MRQPKLSYKEIIMKLIKLILFRSLKVAPWTCCTHSWLTVSLRGSLTHYPYSQVPSLTHCLTHSQVCSLTHCLTHSLTGLLTHSLSHSLTHRFPHSSHSQVCSLTHSLTHCHCRYYYCPHCYCSRDYCGLLQ